MSIPSARSLHPSKPGDCTISGVSCDNPNDLSPNDLSQQKKSVVRVAMSLQHIERVLLGVNLLTSGQVSVLGDHVDHPFMTG